MDEYNKILDKEVKEFEPQIALSDNTTDGLSFYKRIAELLPDILKPGKYFFAEIGYNQSDSVLNIFDKVLINIQIIKDLASNDRVICGTLR